MENIALVVLLIAFWQWRMLQGPVPPSRWTVNVDERCLVLMPSISRVASDWTSSPVSVWMTDEEFVFLEGIQKKGRELVDAWPLGSIRRDSIQELFLIIGKEACAAIVKICPAGRGEKLASDLGEDSILLMLHVVDEESGSRVLVFLLDRSTLVSGFHGIVIDFFRERATAPFRVTI